MYTIPFSVLSLAMAEGRALVKYWCMLNRREETSSLSGTVADIMALGVRGHEIPRTWASSNALEKETTAFNTTFIHIIIIYSTKTVGNLGEGTNVGMVDALAEKKSNLLTSLLFSFMALGETASMSLQV